MRFIKFLFFIVFIMSFNFFNVDKVYANSKENLKLDYEELSESVIRFHFIANSDSEFDQYVKNNVKDRVMSYLEKDGNLKSDKIDNINYLLVNSNKIREIALDVLDDYGVLSDVTIDIGRKYFKERTYGTYVIPEGEYDYFILNIGDAFGRNFWSLLFSSIGFIQSDDKNIDSIPAIIRNNKKDFEVFNSTDKKSRMANKSEVKICFKIFDTIREFFKKIF